jgi:hypothetical protein
MWFALVLNLGGRIQITHFGFLSRANFCASAISAGVISAASALAALSRAANRDRPPLS